MENKKSRTQYSARNVTAATICKAAAILMGFFSRVVFTHTLSVEYVGINGLFIDILNVLALSELGISTAISYALYLPIKEGDIEKQKSLMQLFKKCYRVVALVILGMALMVIPFLKTISGDAYGVVPHITIVYLLYVASSVFSYTFIYKKILVDAHQMNYVGTLIQNICLLIQAGIQMVLLYLTHNFILYLVIWIVSILLGNILTSIRANQLFPYLKDKNIEPLSNEESKGIFSNVKAMMLHKIGNVMVYNTDNILLSVLTGIANAGIYSNYFLIIGSITQLTSQVFQGITASVGNLGVSEDEVRIKKIFDTTFFIGQWMFGFAAITLYELLNPFVEFAFGKTYVFPLSITLILCINFYITGMRQSVIVFRDSMGLFKYDQYKAIPEALINLGVSIFLGTKIGVMGIFIGTFVSTITTSLWIEPYVLYKYRLKVSVWWYFLKFAIYSVVTACLWFGCDYLCQKVSYQGIPLIAARLFICIFFVNAIYLVIYFNTKEFKLIIGKLRKLLGKEAKEKKVNISFEEECLMEMVATALKDEMVLPFENNYSNEVVKKQKYDKWNPAWNQLSDSDILEFAKKQKIPTLLYQALSNRPSKELFEHATCELAKETRVYAKRSYYLCGLANQLVDALEKEGVEAAIMKGASIARYYNIPEYRIYGDIDLFIKNDRDLQKAIEVLEKLGAVKNQVQPHVHHVTLVYKDKVEIELHRLLSEPFENVKANEYLKKIQDEKAHAASKELYGSSLKVLDDETFLTEVAMHMLQHLLWAGIGIRFFADWTCIMRSEFSDSTKDAFLLNMKECGALGFVSMVTKVCIEYFGLEEKKANWIPLDETQDSKLFVRDMLDAGLFGADDKSRLGIVYDKSISGYFRELHHQMKNNHPKASKIVVIWPALWIITGVVFVINNHRYRNTSTLGILKKAYQRSELLENISLWKQ